VQTGSNWTQSTTTQSLETGEIQIRLQPTSRQPRDAEISDVIPMIE